mmetsp:Transcript_10730/g.35209  ORF Transcript_10730/g.35209 Transcript_10730/m.35209 type:complete len:219 (-) Transcript_10730:376-1032(-)
MNALSRPSTTVTLSRRCTNVRQNRARRAGVPRAAASDPDIEAQGEGEIGLGIDMEAMLEAAAGGPTVPSWVPDVPQLKDALKQLGSEDTVISDKLLVEDYGKEFNKALGFSETAELINGRCAMLAFVLAIQNTFGGDILTLMAKYPLWVIMQDATIISASLVPVVMPKGYLPEGIKTTIDGLVEKTPLSDVFTAKAEQINGRAAMCGVSFFLFTAILF